MLASYHQRRLGQEGLRLLAKRRKARFRYFNRWRSWKLPGVFGVELEVVPDRVAQELAKRTTLVLLGMGAGPYADAQYLFAEDVLGCSSGHKPRHAKTYRNFRAEYDRLQRERIAAFREYKHDVDCGAYPETGHSVAILDGEFDGLLARLNEAVA